MMLVLILLLLIIIQLSLSFKMIINSKIVKGIKINKIKVNYNVFDMIANFHKV